MTRKGLGFVPGKQGKLSLSALILEQGERVVQGNGCKTNLFSTVAATSSFFFRSLHKLPVLPGTVCTNTVKANSSSIS